MLLSIGITLEPNDLSQRASMITVLNDTVTRYNVVTEITANLLKNESCEILGEDLIAVPVSDDEAVAVGQGQP